MGRRTNASNVIDLASRRVDPATRERAYYHLLCGPSQAVLVCAGALDASERAHFDAVMRRLEQLETNLVVVMTDVTVAEPRTVSAVFESQLRRDALQLPRLELGSCSAVAKRALSRAHSRRSRHVGRALDHAVTRRHNEKTNVSKPTAVARV